MAPPTGHPIDLTQGEGEIPLRRVAHANAPLPLSKSIELGAVSSGNRLPVGIFVLPPDRRRQAFVVDRVGHRSTGAGSLLALLHVEGPPFRALIDHLVGEHEAALLADQLSAFVVEREVPRIALRTSSDFFGLSDLLGWHGFPHQRRRRLRSGTERRGRPAAPRRKGPGLGRTPLPPPPQADFLFCAPPRPPRGRDPSGGGTAPPGRGFSPP